MSDDELTLGHHLFYYTFLPAVTLTFSAILLHPLLYFYGPLSLRETIALPWIVVSCMSLYLYFLGDYCMPIETYRQRRGVDN